MERNQTLKETTRHPKSNRSKHQPSGKVHAIGEVQIDEETESVHIMILLYHPRFPEQSEQVEGLLPRLEYSEPYVGSQLRPYFVRQFAQMFLCVLYVTQNGDNGELKLHV